MHTLRQQFCLAKSNTANANRITTTIARMKSALTNTYFEGARFLHSQNYSQHIYKLYLNEAQSECNRTNHRKLNTICL